MTVEEPGSGDSRTIAEAVLAGAKPLDAVLAQMEYIARTEKDVARRDIFATLERPGATSRTSAK